MSDVTQEIEREIRDNKVVIYMKGTPSFPIYSTIRDVPGLELYQPE